MDGVRTARRDCGSCGGTGGRLHLALALPCPWESLCESDPEGCACAAKATRLPAPQRECTPKPRAVLPPESVAELEAVLHVWQAVMGAGAYADLAAVTVDRLQKGVTPEGVEELLHCLERLHEATGTAMVVVQAEFRDQLHPLQLPLELGGAK